MKVISGGQSGADRAALDSALANGRRAGGWCPKGRLAEDGIIDDRYPLRETSQRDYAQRTRLNVRDSDATLIVARRPLKGGTALTERLALACGKPCLVVHPDETPEAIAVCRSWIERHRVQVLNVAGPRHSTSTSAYSDTRRIMDALLAPTPLRAATEGRSPGGLPE